MVLTRTRTVLESRTPGGSVSSIRLWVLLEIQLLMASRASSGSACRTGLALRLKVLRRGGCEVS